MRNQGTDMKLYRKYVASMAQVYNQREDVRAFVELLLTLVAIFIFVVFAIRPTLKTVGGLTQEINTKKELIKTMDQKIENIQKAQASYSEASSILPFLLSAVPGSPDAISHITQLEKIGTTSGAKVISINMDSIPLKNGDLSTSGLKDVTFTITFNGSYESLIKTMELVQDMRRGGLFTNTLITQGDSNDSGSLNFTISEQVPYYIVNTN